MTSLVARAWRQTLILACAVLLLAIAPGHAEDRSVLRREIEAMHVRYLDAFNHRDAAALGALFAENGIFVDPAGKVATGRSDIEAMFRQGSATAISRSRRASTTSAPSAMALGMWDMARSSRAGAPSPCRCTTRPSMCARAVH